jgi:HAD superfamily hydrolase (TIGR01459 family)
MTTHPIAFSSLEAVLQENSCNALLLDAYGVFWSGNEQGAFPGSSLTMERLFAAGKKIGIVSNSTQLSQKEVQKYAAHGFLQDRHFHFLITSGDVAKGLFYSDRLPLPTPNKKYYLFCSPHPRYSNSSSLFEGTSFIRTEDLSEADFIYINVPHIAGEDQTESDVFRPMVERFLLSRKPMVCANPDRFAHEGLPPRPVVRQGSIASLYEEMDGEVFNIGKPFLQIYSLAFDRLNSISPTMKEEVLMVGDTPETDIRGARSFGIKSALITGTGIMAERIKQKGFCAVQDLPLSDTPNLFVESFSNLKL